ncbi:hypothetical protein [Methylobacterium sp. Leaf93]|uniref:hypothetical protein n=1 Tax=Methylobacterium sp. Leaf93 TaxID=1736249 RepID=UPI0006FC3197|nr:hypothetical protein [Methylobacterium sp. Leaf93]KQP06982.1 hypothetical protein ASF26_07350 [Methylobacterium sp. Leaf93]
MLATDPTVARPTLTGLRNLTAALAQIGKDTASPAEVWRRLTDSYVVDLDAVASILPRAEPEPTWLVPRNEDRLVTGRSRASKVSLRA